MITTPGKIPNEMYDIENTSFEPEATSTLDVTVFNSISNSHTITEEHISASDKIIDTKESEIAEPSILLIVGIIIGTLLLFGCIVACAISRAKRNYDQLNNKDVEYNAADRPLLSRCKRKDSSTSNCCRN